MKEFTRILDYIIEQSDRYDSTNLQVEEDVQFLLKKKKADLDISVLSYVRNMDNSLDVTIFMQSITKVFQKYYNDVALIYDKNITSHYNSGYEQTEDLIRIGKELEGKLFEGIKEAKYNEYDEKTIDFIKQHAMEQAKGYSEDKINKLRSAISNLMLQGKANKATIRDTVQKVLDVDRSKAEDIARTELSRAYNYGVLDRLNEYAALNPGSNTRKYWHGFAYSKNTCTYCRPRIGQVYDINDHTEVLPAHVRCRCVWLPVLEGWDTSISRQLTNRANMLNTAYSDEYIYDRISSRLGITYANYIDRDTATYPFALVLIVVACKLIVGLPF